MPFFFWCEICHRHHWSHYHSQVELLFAFDNPSQGGIEIMANTIDIASPTTTFYGAPGQLTDAQGNVVDDTVASLTWASGDATDLTVAPDPANAVNAVFTVLANGTVPITAEGTTAAGNAITGTGSATITGFATVGPAVNVELNLTTTSPDTPAPVPPA